MRLLICAGGTGGGVYPALSVLKQLKSMHPDQVPAETAQTREASPEDLRVLWVGSRGGMEADLVKREGVRFETIPAAGVHGVGVRALPRNVWQLSRGLLASRRIMRKFHPDVLFFTGGYVAVPMALAARLSKQATSLLYVPDIEPGLALKTIARFSDRVCLTVEESKAFFPKKQSTVVTGYPLRPGLDSWTQAEARSFFALEEQLPILLVFGGSKGARSINQAIIAALPQLLDELQVIHITGKLDWQMVEKARTSLSAEQLNRYRPYAYLYDEIGAAMSIANLALTRAGASTLGELPIFGLPAILVPYPYAWRYQRVNASYLVRHGSAVQIEDARLAEEVLPKVRELISDTERLQSMSQAMRSLAQPQAAAKIAAQLWQLAAPTKQKGTQNVPDPADRSAG